MKGWKASCLGDMIHTNQKTLGKNYPFSEILYLDTGSITRGKVDSFQYIRLKEAPSRAKRLVQANDIIYSAVRPINRHYGFFSTPPKNIVVSTGFIVISCNERQLDANFLYYYLTQNNIVEEFESIADGSTSAYPSLVPSDIEKLEIIFPEDINEQKAIAAVLSSLDDKIDLLHRQNATLEAMAEALFRQWFVVEAKDEWGECPLGSLLQLNYGKALSEQNRKGFGFPVVGSGGIVGFHDEYLVKGPGIVTGRKGTLGQVMLLEDNFYPIDTTFYISTKMLFFPIYYFYFLLKTLKLDEMNSDSAVPGLNRDAAHGLKIADAPHDVIQEYDNVVSRLFLKIQSNQTQIRTLEKLRDTLLPKLMSGEVRVEY